MIDSIIIDDSKNDIELLSGLIKQNCPQVNLLASAKSVGNGITLFNQLKPSFIFLDIEIGQQTGFDFLNQIQGNNFKVIFTSGFNI